MQKCGNGWKLWVLISLSACGGKLTNTSGQFSSPLYPNNYPNDLLCKWQITVPVGEQIKMDFRSFNLQSGSNCKYDFVLVQDRKTPNSSLVDVGKYCGYNIPPSYLSTENELHIQFKTDSWRNYKGFEISYVIYSNVNGTSCDNERRCSCLVGFFGLLCEGKCK